MLDDCFETEGDFSRPLEVILLEEGDGGSGVGGGRG